MTFDCTERNLTVLKQLLHTITVSFCSDPEHRIAFNVNIEGARCQLDG